MNHLGIIFKAITLILFTYSTQAWARYDFGYSIDAELVNSVNEGKIPPESQSFFTIEQNWISADKKMKGLVQARLFTFTSEIEKIRFSGSEIYPVDTYIEYLPPSQRITLGYQHIFLTEGFDTVGMELVNPRNQNSSFFLDADKKFYTVPALNYRYISEMATLQLFHVFQYRADEPNMYMLNQISSLNMGLQSEKISNSESFKKNDQGLRLLKSIGHFDLSLSYLKTYDKTNQYNINQQTFRLDQQADSSPSYLFNMSGDVAGWVLRFDYLLSRGRKTMMPTTGYMSFDYDNLNIGLEHDFIYSSQIAVNYSRSEVKADQDPLFRKKLIEDLYLRWDKTLAGDFKIHAMLLYRVSDKGQAVNLKATYPLSSLINVKAGLETFGGEKNSAFMLAKDLSRVYVGLFSTIF